jgi:signal transduction histidine kinase
LAQTDLGENLPRVRADRVQLQQVILNLISNAVEAMRFVSDRPRLLAIKSELHAPDGVLVTFKDTGTGIARQDVDRIFAPFVTTKSNGMGMGLAICRSIVEAHGGRIWVTPVTSTDRSPRLLAKCIVWQASGALVLLIGTPKQSAALTASFRG